MTGHQFFKVVVGDHWKLVGTVDYTDKVKKKFYLTKMTGILKKSNLLVKTKVVKSTGHPNKEYVELFARKKPLKKYSGVAWVHPKGGGDDYQVNVKTQAENLTIAKKQVREHLIKDLHTHPAMAGSFRIKEVKR